MDIESISQSLRAFAEERDWDQFHSPKNLAMALGAEAGELLEIFQWLTEDQANSPDEKTLQKAREELADVVIYAIRISDKLGVDLEDAIKRKIEKNRKKYPVFQAKGNARKYTEFE